MKKRAYILVSGVLIGAMLTLNTACTTDGVDCPECSVLERTDISITGALNAENFQMSMQSDELVDLVSYNYYGPQMPQLDFKVRLVSGDYLLITLMDREVPNAWQYEGKAYHCYPNEDLEDKLSYVTMDYVNSEGGIAYTTNGVNASVHGICLDVFRITENTGVQMRCRLRDLTLHNTSNPDQVIHVNGTFVGALTF